MGKVEKGFDLEVTISCVHSFFCNTKEEAENLLQSLQNDIPADVLGESTFEVTSHSIVESECETIDF